ncbi:hypothetical protein LEMLEM_LOCUS14705 [Lemmus lemmus]
MKIHPSSACKERLKSFFHAESAPAAATKHKRLGPLNNR